MAFVSAGWKYSVSLMDNGGGVTVKQYDLTSTNASEAAIDSAAVLAALTAVTDCEVISNHFYEQFVEDTVVYPAAGVQKENQALLVFSIEGNPMKKATHSIPAPKQSIFKATSGKSADIVDDSDTDVIAYVALFQNGNEVTISDGETADVLIEGRRRHSRNNRG